MRTGGLAYPLHRRGILPNRDADGVVREVVAGDEFVIPRGFEGVWEVIEHTRKVYVIYEGAE
jgi:uncharacterized cupin superfamily protein